MAANQHRSRRGFSLVGVDPLPEVHVDAADTVPMTDEQYTAAVTALAVLIEGWRDARPTPADADTRPLAA